MRSVSKKRQKRDAGYALARRKVWVRSEGACEGMVSKFCTRRCEQVHHKAGRRGDDPHRLDNLLGLCAPCHEWAHRNPVQAIEAGVSVSRLKVGDE
jgi:hypothetical protein